MSSVIPDRNTKLYEVWESLQNFMIEVKNEYHDGRAGYSTSEAYAKAIEWAERIRKAPFNLGTLKLEWEATRLDLRNRKVVQQTQKLLEAHNVPPSLAHQHALDYVRDLNKIGLVTKKDPRIQQLQANLKALAKEYEVRGKLPPPLVFPSLYSPIDMYQYIIDAALRGEWFPFATYVASQNGTTLNPIQVGQFDMSQEEYEKALSIDRQQQQPQSTILWNNIFTVVGLSGLATLIYKGLVKLFQLYQLRENVFVVQLVTRSDPAPVWAIIKNILKVGTFRSYKKHAIVTYPRDLIQSDITKIKSQLETGLKAAGVKSKISAGTTQHESKSCPTFRVQISHP
jgi:tetratricopeptide (TPR) repeat protein